MAGLQSARGDEGPFVDSQGSPYQVIRGYVEREPRLGVQSEDRLAPVGLDGDDPGEPVGVVHLGADGIRLDELTDGPETLLGAHHGVVGLARARLLRDTRDADVEPHRGVEGGPLVDDQVGQLVVERVRLVVVDEVTALATPLGDGVDDAPGDLLERPLPLGRAQRPPEVLLGQDVGGVDTPPRRHLHPELLEGHGTGEVVGDPGVTPLPPDGVEGIGPRRREVSVDSNPDSLGGHCHPQNPPCVVGPPAWRSCANHNLLW